MTDPVTAGSFHESDGLAGGVTVRRDIAPSWWTLADAAGNEADIATVTGRD